MLYHVRAYVMAQTTTADGGAEGKNSVEIEDGQLTYRYGGHDPRVVREFSGDIQTRGVNQYTTVETQYRGFESTVSSNAERDGAYLLWVRPDGEYRIVDLHSPEATGSPDPNADDARYLYSGDWDYEIVDGVRVKTVHSRSDTYESSATKRTKIERGHQAEHGLIFGATGTGKTCLAKYATDQLRRVTDLNVQHVNCWEDNTRFQILHQVVSSFDHSTPGRSAADINSLLTRIESYTGPPFVVILDEAELLRDPNIIRDYHGRRGFSLIVIANDREEFFAEVPAAVETRLHGPIATLEPYSITALVAILEDRADQGLRTGVIDAEQLEMIADHAAGNAQKAITTLRLAARQGRRERGGTITDAMIADAAGDAEKVIRDAHIGRLLDHQKIVYDVVCESDEWLTTSGVYEKYSERVDGDPRSNRTIRKYLSKLAEYDLIAKDGATRGRTYHSRQ